MKTLKLPVPLLVSLLFLLFTGCTKDDSSTTNPTRDSYLGTWMVSESHTKSAYEVVITSDPTSGDGVLISGFANTLPSGPYAGATVAGDRITLDANQVIGDGLKINGSGVLTGSKINWTYTIDDGANLVHAVAVYTKL